MKEILKIYDTNRLKIYKNNGEHKKSSFIDDNETVDTDTGVAECACGLSRVDR